MLSPALRGRILSERGNPMDTKGFEKKPWFPYVKNMYDEIEGDMMSVDAKGYEEKPWWPYVLDLQEKIDAGGGGDSALDAFIEGSTENIVSNALSVRENAFWYMKKLKTVFLPEAVSTGSNAFKGCVNLESVRMPKCTDLGYSNFEGATKFHLLDVNAPNIPSKAPFTGSSMFDTLILRCNKVPYWSNQYGIFGPTKFQAGKGGGTMYVPADLIDSYKTANMWKTYFGDGDARTNGDANNKILPIEGSEYEL